MATIIAIILTFVVPIAGWRYARRQSGRRRTAVRLGVVGYTVAVWAAVFVVVYAASPPSADDAQPGQAVLDR